MKNFLFLIISIISFNVFSQHGLSKRDIIAQNALGEDSLKGFSMEEMNRHLVNFKGTEKEKQIRIQGSKRAFIDRKYKLGAYDIPKLVRSMNARLNGNQSVQTANCTNIGFDNGTTSGWTTAGAGATNLSSFGTGAPTAGDITITSGTGLDPYGNYPVVYAGAHSLQLSKDVNTSGNYLSTASRIISVPNTGNTFFDLNFAIDILDYPHSQADCAWFSIDFYDASGQILPCPQYQCYFYQNSGNVGTSVGISSFQQTWGSVTAQTGPGVNIGSQHFPVTYAPWQTIAMDLTSYGGTNVTCVVSCSWCLYNYDWAYCYIDADCPTTNTGGSSSCGALPFELDGPSGFDNYSWAPPPGNNPGSAATYSINASVAGTYTLHASLNTCSTTAAYTFTYNVQPGPIPNFTSTAVGSCSGNLTFTSTSTPNGGPPITGYSWDWGDGTPNGLGINATHSFSSIGSNTVTLIVTNGSCTDSISSTVVIPPHPIANFTVTNNCLNAITNYTSTSTASAGIATQNWSFGDSNHGAGATPSHTYASVGTYSVTLVLTDNNACIDSITKSITINPLPTITVNSPTLCAGLHNATLTAAGASTYTWNPAATLSSPNGSPVSANTPVTTNYTVTGTDVNGCVNVATTTIVVNSAAAITVNSSTICLGQQTATLTASGSANYVWSPSTGLTTPSGSVVTGSPGATTNYTVTGTDAAGCVSTATTSIAINALPAIPPVSSNTPCVQQPGFAINLTCSLNGMNSYYWSGPNSYTSNIQNPVVASNNVTAADAGTYSVLVVDNNSCYNSAIINVTVNPKPIIIATGATVCIGQPINLTASGAGNAPSATYSWNGPNGFNPIAQNPSIAISDPTMIGIYNVVGTDINGCYSATFAHVIVNPLPVISVNSATICAGQQTATLTANGAISYAWNPSNSLNTNTGSVVYGVPPVSTTYTVTGTDINGCIDTASASIDIVSPPVIATSSVTPACVPVSATLTVTSNPAAANYTWNFGNGQALNSGTLSPASGSFMTSTTFTLAGTNPISLSVTDINGCTSTLTSSVVTYAIPIADFIFEPQPVNILDPQVEFLNQSYGSISTYNWNFGDTTSAIDTSNLVSPTHNYLNVGTYSVTLTVTSAQGCSSTVVKPLVVNETYVIYVPNAFSPNVDGKNDIFKAVGEGIKTFDLYIFDRWGNKLFYSQDINKGWNGTMQGVGSQILQEDVYVWKIDLTDFSNKSKSLHGTVTLLK